MNDLATLDLDISNQVANAPEPTDTRKAGPPPVIPNQEKPRENQETALAHPETNNGPMFVNTETNTQENLQTNQAPGVGPQVKDPQPFSEPPTTKDGYYFDPRIIQCTGEGKPRLTPGGHWLLKKKGWEKGLELIHQEQAEAWRDSQEINGKETAQDNQEETPREEPGNQEEIQEPQVEEQPGAQEEPEPLPLDNQEENTQEPQAGAVEEPPPLFDLEGEDPLKEIPNRELAELISDTFIFKGISIVGEEFAPMVVDPKSGRTDRDRMADRWEAYLKTTNTAENLPAWSLPLMSMLAYTTTRAMKPKSKTQGFLIGAFKRTQAKAKVWALWLKAKFTGRSTAEVLEDQEAKA